MSFLPARKARAVIQAEHSECGLACVTHILNSYGEHISLSSLRDTYGVPRGGLTFNNLRSVFLDYSYGAQGIKTDSLPTAILALKKHVPFIAQWEDNHYVVVIRVSRSRVQIMDPATGYEYISHQELTEKATGSFLLIDSPHKKKQRVFRGTRTSTAPLLSLLKSSKTRMFVAALLLLGVKLLALIPPEVIRRILDAKNTGSDAVTVPLLGIYILVALFFSVLSIVVSARLAMRWSKILNVTFVDTLLGKKLEFFINRSHGGLLYKLNLMGSIQNILTSITVTSIVDYLSLIVYFLFLAYLSLALSLVTFLAMTLVVISSIIYARKISRLNRKALEEQSHAQAVITEALASPETIQSNYLENRIKARWKRKFDASLETTYRITLVSGIFQSALSLILTVIPLLIILTATKTPYLNHTFTVGTLFAFITVIGYIGVPIGTIGNNILQFGTLQSTIDQIEDIFEKHNQRERHEQVTGISGETSVKISVQNLDFQFNSFEGNILHDINLSISHGSKIAIVGISGSGKSTLLRLLAGLITSLDGIVRYESDTKSDYTASDVVAFVPQDSNLFGDTLLENLGVDEDAQLSPQLFGAVYESCGLENIVGNNIDLSSIRLSESGKNLSGGQKQRISIARALLRDKPVILLDEPTSSLDAQSEEKISHFLSVLPATVILVSHRLSSIAKMDHIIVIDDGRIVEQGALGELFESKGAFYSLFESQRI